MYNPASVLWNEMHKLLLDIEMQTDHLILDRRLDLVIIYKKKRELAELKSRRMISTWTLLGNWKNCGTWKWRYTNCNWCFLYSHQRINKGTVGLGSKRTSGDNPNYGITEIRQNTEKSPGDLRRLAVAQTPVKNHQLKLMWKTLKE